MAGRTKHTDAKAVGYKRTAVKVRTRRGREPFEYDTELADKLLEESLDSTKGDLKHASPKGVCYDCGKQVPPMRKLCGGCLSKRIENR